MKEAKTEDGREVAAVYTGNLFEVFVQEHAGSRYSKNVFCSNSESEADRAVDAIVANGGELPSGFRAVR
jgi:hypothetical protein